MAHGLVGVDRGAANDQVARFGPHGTVLPTLGTGVDRAEALGVLSEQLLDGPLGQGLRGVDGDLFEGVEIDIVGRSGLAEGASGDDFSPVQGQVTEFGGSRRLSLPEGRRTSSLGLGEIEKMGNSS